MKSPTKAKGRTQKFSKLLSDARSNILNGEYEAALNLLETQKEHLKDDAEILSLMGVVAIRVQNFAYAIQMFQQAQDLPEASTDIPEILAVLHALVGNLPESLYCAKLSSVKPHDNRILGLLGPSFPGFANVFTRIKEKPLVAAGETLLAESRFSEAASKFSQHVALNPRDEEGYDGLTRALVASGEVMTAVNMVRSLRMLAPQNAAYASRLGTVLAMTGEHATAGACHRQAILLDPKSVQSRYAHLRDLAYSPSVSAEAMAAARRGLSDLFSERMPAAAPQRPAVSSRAIRLGYLVGGLTEEDGIAMLADVLRHHDRSRFTLIGLGHGDIGLPHNRPFQMRFERWINVRGVNERTFSSLVRGEGIDVLVDLGGLQAPEHIFAVALHAAPLQISWRIEPVDFSTPGADFEMVDGAADVRPVGQARPWKIASGLYAFKRPGEADDMPIFPAETNGYVAFGADATLAQLNPDVVMTFCRILSAVPDSMLLLRDRGHTDSRTVQKIVDLFGNFGMAHRVDVVTAASRGEFLRETDLQLVPFPFARPFLVAEAIGGGVPVVSLDRSEGACRDVAALLRRVGADADMLASSEDAYVAMAVGWAEDRAKRQAFWKTGRSIAASSEVFDVARLAAALEESYGAMIGATTA